MMKEWTMAGDRISVESWNDGGRMAGGGEGGGPIVSYHSSGKVHFEGENPRNSVHPD